MPLHPVSCRGSQEKGRNADVAGLGQLKPDTMITRKIKMNEIEEKGFKTLVHDKDNHVKILVEVSP